MITSWLQSNFKRLCQQDPFDIVSGFYFFLIVCFMFVSATSLCLWFLTEYWKKYRHQSQNTKLQRNLQAYLRGFATHLYANMCKSQNNHKWDVDNYNEIQKYMNLQE